MNTEKVAIVYIARGGEGALDSASRFLRSYQSRRPGRAHELKVIVKGWGSESELNRLKSMFEGTVCEFLTLADDGFDLGAYMRAAPRIEADWLLFLNSHSVILADDWAEKLYVAASQPGIGAAGATGSWESQFTTLSRLPHPAGSLASLKNRAELLWYRFHIPRFPNVHLRTNAFMMRSSDWLEFASKTRIPASKRQAYAVESGRAGLTAFLRRKNLRVVVCGADGRSFPIKEWPNSGTYFVGDQSNLLISDNQTRRYEQADSRTRGGMQIGSWGYPIDAS
jgi:hypothetical protein